MKLYERLRIMNWKNVMNERTSERINEWMNEWKTLFKYQYIELYWR